MLNFLSQILHANCNAFTRNVPKIARKRIFHKISHDPTTEEFTEMISFYDT